MSQIPSKIARALVALAHAFDPDVKATRPAAQSSEAGRSRMEYGPKQ